MSKIKVQAQEVQAGDVVSRRKSSPGSKVATVERFERAVRFLSAQGVTIMRPSHETLVWVERPEAVEPEPEPPAETGDEQRDFEFPGDHVEPAPREPAAKPKPKRRRVVKLERPKGGWKTREEWLNHAAQLCRPAIEAHGVELPPVRVSVGWPKGSRGGKSVHAIGQCWCKSASADGTHEIFVSPELDDPARVLDVLAHELVHAACGISAGHGPEFARVAKGIGLQGRMTATVAGPEFETFAKAATKTLGRFPHAALGVRGSTSGNPKPKGGPEAGPEGGSDSPKQGTRMLKATCDDPECGMVVRTTRKWIESPGLPKCACGGQFVEGDGGES